MKHVLITGGNGYIASSLYKALCDVYNITTVTRNDFDLTNSKKTNDWFDGKYFDVVIHTAIQGGSRLKNDTSNVLDQNLLMYYNLLTNKDKFDRFISIGSGAELHQINTPYGFSKHVIRQSILGIENFYNIRVFAVFDENELDTRFIKANVKLYSKKQPIIIHQNKVMDFFYMKDFVKLMQYYIENDNLPKEIDCSYPQHLHLTEIANIINGLSNYEVAIKIENGGLRESYSGTFTDIGINFIGLERGIREVFTQLNLNQYELPI